MSIAFKGILYLLEAFIFIVILNKAKPFVRVKQENVPLVIDCHRLVKEKDIPFSPESMGVEVPAWS